jgi:hypothetical protein
VRHGFAWSRKVCEKLTTKYDYFLLPFLLKKQLSMILKSLVFIRQSLDGTYYDIVSSVCLSDFLYVCLSGLVGRIETES